MGIRESNSKRVLLNGSTQGEREKNIFKNAIINEFTQSPSYFEVYFNDLTIKTGVQIVENSVKEKVDNCKTILMKPMEIINIGDFIKWLNDYWLCTSREMFNDLYYKGSINKCTHTLKFVDKTSILNAIVSAPCVVSSTTVSSLGIDNQKQFDLLEGKIIVQIPNNKSTSTIYEKQRFILGRNAYVVTGIDDITSLGILKISMEKVEKDSRDNFETGVAWNSEIIPNNYSISILNGQELSVNTLQDIQLNVEVKNNNVVVYSPELLYASSNESICTVNSLGLIHTNSVGNCMVTICLKSEPDIKATVNIKVEDVVADNKTVIINGVNKIYKNKSVLYSCNFKNNGVVYTDQSHFYLTEEDGITPLSSDIACISSQDEHLNQCTITTKYFSGIKYCKLFAKSTDNSVVSGGFEIIISSLI